jgi:hypothetical protein
LVHIGKKLEIKFLDISMTTWFTLCPFDIFYDNLAHFMVIGDIFPQCGICCTYQEKSGKD